MNTPDKIEHNGKTLVRLPDINDAREGDWVMISERLFVISETKKEGYSGDIYYLSVNYNDYSDLVEFIQAAYREKKTEVYKWFVPNQPMSLDITDYVNKTLSDCYGSPESLMRKGAEQAIQLTEKEWQTLERDFDEVPIAVYCRKVFEQALANCRPKGGSN